MIEIKNASFSYSNGTKKSGLKNINLRINDGEVILFCGGSGCGKTTLTRMINGLIPHYYEGNLTGEVIINGNPIHKLPLYETAKLVGSVFQNPRSQFFNVDTTSELAFGAENMGLPPKEIEQKTKTVVKELCIENLMNRSIFELSGGEKQKIACASISVCDAPIIVLDEPSSNLDAKAIEELRRLINIWKNKGKTIIIAEHRLYYLKELADRIFFMKQGKIEKEFSKNQFNSLSEGTISYMGLRQLNLQKLRKKNSIFPSIFPKFTLHDFTFSYKHTKKNAIELENLEIPLGGIIAIVGHNGAGKSTFARCLCGLEKRCKGILYMDNKKFNNKKRLASCYMVMQDVNHQLFTESVLDEVLLSMKYKDDTKAEKILESLDLISMKELHPMSLSGGEQQRVAIASALESNRNIILFDEPTSGLDLKHMKEVSLNMKKLCAQGKTILVITHDLELIFECCTHVLQLESGKVASNYLLDKEGEKKLKNFFFSLPSSKERLECKQMNKSKRCQI